MPKPTDEIPMRLIAGCGLKRAELKFGKVCRIFSIDRITYVPASCVKAALSTKIIEEVKDQNAN